MDLFVGKWKITKWIPDTEDIVPQGIPGDGFMLDGPLNIMRELTLTSDFYRVEWLTENSQPCFAAGLQLVEGFQELSPINGQGLLVNFAGRQLYCSFTLTLALDDSSTLTGSIRLTGEILAGKNTPNVGSGTFTATAHPDG